MSRRDRFEGSEVRKILTGMITNRAVCSRVAAVWPLKGLFAQVQANTIGKMVVDHFKKYNEPPGNLMPAIFEDWAKTTLSSEEEIGDVETLLRSISDERHSDSSEYLLDLAGRHFDKISLEQAVAAVQLDLSENLVEDARTKIEAIRKVNLGVGAYTEPLSTPDPWLSAFSSDRARALVYYDQDLHSFVGDAFQRGRFFSFMAPDKTGKTTWLIDLVYRAVRAKNRVAFFDTGDGTQQEFMRRLAIRTEGKPLREGRYLMPQGWKVDNDKVTVDAGEEFFEGVEALGAYSKLRHLGRSDGLLRASFYPSSTLSAADLESVLAEWDLSQDWRPDVVVVDYADILAPPKGIKEELAQIDETWKTLHRIAQQRHCLVFTATQAAASAYGKEEYLLTKRDFSGRKTKLAHVDGMLGINVSNAEKAVGAARINWIVRRSDAYNEQDFCRVAGSMAIGSPALMSRRK